MRVVRWRPKERRVDRNPFWNRPEVLHGRPPSRPKDTVHLTDPIRGKRDKRCEGHANDKLSSGRLLTTAIKRAAANNGLYQNLYPLQSLREGGAPLSRTTGDFDLFARFLTPGPKNTRLALGVNI